MPKMFKTSRDLEDQIDAFLDTVSEGALVFQQGVCAYLEDRNEQFNDLVLEIDDLENRADDLRRDIKNQLYRHSLIPESRGDVLALLETLDDVINTAKQTLNLFLVERPELLPGMADDWSELVATATSTAESVVLAGRAFFRDPRTVNDHLHKVYFFEKEGDRQAMALKQKIFQSDIDLARKMHLRDFALHVDMLSDAAEDVADRLNIYAIKRTV